jgi:hypothetical protein
MRTWHIGLAAVAATGVALPVMAALPAIAATNPPPGYTSYTPVVYGSTNGTVHLVKPWGVAGASIPNCTPPSPWALAGVTYDPTPCNTGGSFDAKSGEFYTELPAGFSSDLMTEYINVGYSSSSGSARVLPPWGVAGASIPNCTPPALWQIPGVSYDPTPCNTGGSFATKNGEFYTELQLLLKIPQGDPRSPGLSDAGSSTSPPSSYTVFVPLAYDASTGAMRFVRPWGVAGQAIPNCTPPSPWALAGVTYDPTPCNTGGVFDAKTSELYTELALLS